jgi:hypothetical protein
MSLRVRLSITPMAADDAALTLRITGPHAMEVVEELAEAFMEDLTDMVPQAKARLN